MVETAQLVSKQLPLLTERASEASREANTATSTAVDAASQLHEASVKAREETAKYVEVVRTRTNVFDLHADEVKTELEGQLQEAKRHATTCATEATKARNSATVSKTEATTSKRFSNKCSNFAHSQQSAATSVAEAAASNLTAKKHAEYAAGSLLLIKT